MAFFLFVCLFGGREGEQHGCCVVLPSLPWICVMCYPCSDFIGKQGRLLHVHLPHAFVCCSIKLRRKTQQFYHTSVTCLVLRN